MVQLKLMEVKPLVWHLACGSSSVSASFIFPREGTYKISELDTPSKTFCGNAHLFHALFTCHTSIYIAIVYPFFIPPFIPTIHSLSIHCPSSQQSIHPSLTTYPSSYIHHQPTIHLPIIPHQSSSHPHTHSAGYPTSHHSSICLSIILQ
jgi:hypothetical protein